MTATRTVTLQMARSLGNAADWFRASMSLHGDPGEPTSWTEAVRIG